jgi:hypothetical protein
VPLYRGAITVMEHYAANKAKVRAPRAAERWPMSPPARRQHCIRPCDTHTKSASVLLRKIRPRARAELALRKSTAAREQHEAERRLAECVAQGRVGASAPAPCR